MSTYKSCALYQKPNLQLSDLEMVILNTVDNVAVQYFVSLADFHKHINASKFTCQNSFQT